MSRPGPGDVRALLDRVSNLLDRRPPAPAGAELADDAALKAEAERLRPHLEALVDRDYGRLPRVRFRRGLGARLAGPWSQYLTLGPAATRLVLMTPRPASRGALPTVLAHELAHRYAADESLTTLRGLEVSARLGEDSDPLHAASAPRELARMALGAAMVRALAAGAEAEVDRFFAERAGQAAAERPRGQWTRLRGRGGALAPGGADCVTEVYARLPHAALEAAAEAGGDVAGPLPLPRFPLRSLFSLAIATTTAFDALTGRRKKPVPVGATLRLWNSAATVGASPLH